MTDLRSVELAPCPFCGDFTGSYTGPRYVQRASDLYPGKIDHWIECGQCGATGGYLRANCVAPRTEAAALAAWNRRASPEPGVREALDRDETAKLVYDAWVRSVTGPDWLEFKKLPLISPDDYDACFAVADALIAKVAALSRPTAMAGSGDAITPERVREIAEAWTQQHPGAGRTTLEDRVSDTSYILTEALRILTAHGVTVTDGGGRSDG